MLNLWSAHGAWYFLDTPARRSGDDLSHQCSELDQAIIRSGSAGRQ